jgi:hypothetical protein
VFTVSCVSSTFGHFTVVAICKRGYKERQRGEIYVCTIATTKKLYGVTQNKTREWWYGMVPWYGMVW